MQKPLASLVMAKDIFEVLRRTTGECPGKSHDDVTKIVWVPYQAPPARNQESSTTWSQNSFCICRENKKCKYSVETENGIKCELTERLPYERKTSCSGEKSNGTVLSTGNFSEKKYSPFFNFSELSEYHCTLCFIMLPCSLVKYVAYFPKSLPGSLKEQVFFPYKWKGSCTVPFGGKFSLYFFSFYSSPWNSSECGSDLNLSFWEFEPRKMAYPITTKNTKLNQTHYVEGKYIPASCQKVELWSSKKYVSGKILKDWVNFHWLYFSKWWSPGQLPGWHLVKLTIIPQARIGCEMIDHQRGTLHRVRSIKTQSRPHVSSITYKYMYTCQQECRTSR